MPSGVEQAGFGPLLAAFHPAPGRRPRRAAKSAPKAKPSLEAEATAEAEPDPNAVQSGKRLEEQLAKAQARVRELEERLEGLK